MGSRLKVFDLEEANALLPRLEALLSEYETDQERFRQLQDGLFFEELLGEVAPPEDKCQELEEALARLEQQIGKIRELGCLLRHPERGWVDFLAQKGGERIYFCWHRGEKKVQFYHTLQGGFLKRQPLDLTKP